LFCYFLIIFPVGMGKLSSIISFVLDICLVYYFLFLFPLVGEYCKFSNCSVLGLFNGMFIVFSALIGRMIFNILHCFVFCLILYCFPLVPAFCALLNCGALCTPENEYIRPSLEVLKALVIKFTVSWYALSRSAQHT
jgi:hypothetical protein